MRRLILLLHLSISCRAEPVTDPYWEALRASVTEETEYGRDRLLHYRAWQSLPVDDGGLSLGGIDRQAMIRLGKEAFHRYPAQPPFTCATCHSYRGIDGIPNRDLDVGAMLIAAHPNGPPEARAIALSWGKGRVDVSSQTGAEPARIPDLRPVRFLGWLQWSGAVKQNDSLSLSVRIETLIITARNRTVRPPRMLALALALYVDSLADALPMTAPPKVFVDRCGGCHEGPGLSGDRVPADQVGTDETLAHSPDRGTGFYRVPSLRGLGSRGPLMHDGSIADVDALLRSNHAPDLTAEERTSLSEFLRAL